MTGIFDRSSVAKLLSEMGKYVQNILESMHSKSIVDEQQHFEVSCSEVAIFMKQKIPTYSVDGENDTIQFQLFENLVSKSKVVKLHRVLNVITLKII